MTRLRLADLAAPLQVGDTVDFTLIAPGGRRGRRIGTILCLVLNAGAEYDLMIHPSETASDDLRDEINFMLANCDLSLDEIRDGAVYVLRNCQREELKLRSRDVRLPGYPSASSVYR